MTTRRRRPRRGWGTVRQRASGRYQAYYMHGTVRHYADTTFQTITDAEGWLNDERRMIERGTWVPPTVRRAAADQAEADRAANTFEPFALAWLESRHRLRPTTRASYEASLRNHLLPTFGPLPLAEIDAKMVDRWFASYGDRTPTARAHAYQVLSSVMSHAVRRRTATTNPCQIEGGGQAPTKREAEVLTWPELLHLAELMGRHKALTLVCGTGALRFGEAVALRRRDVDLDAGTVDVKRTYVRAAGVKDFNRPKTEAGRRKVTLPAVAVEALREHLAASPVMGRDALVFTGQDGGILSHTAVYGNRPRVERRGKRTYRRPGGGFYAAREVLGRPGMTWHDLRRTALTLAAQAGATVKELQARAGHETADMAMLYQGATAERDRAIAEQMQAQMGGPAGSVTPLPPAVGEEV